MYARRLALFCLLYVSTVFGRPPLGAERDVVVYLKPAGGLSAAALAETKLELVSLMQGMSLRVSWWDWEDSPVSGVPEATLIVGDFLGNCSTPSRGGFSGFLTGMPSLADTSVTDGHILPFAHVNCDALSRFVGSAIANQPSELREGIYGRAIARLLAHEIYHIVAQTREHTRAGIAKQHFSANDLLAEHFEFALPASAAVRKPWTLSADRPPFGLSGANALKVTGPKQPDIP